MVSAARLAVDLGMEVRGSDNPLYPPTSDMVKNLGVEFYTGYNPGNLDWNPDLVIIGNALSRGNPEVESVLERNLHYISLPEFLKEYVLRKRKPVAICGTHGKTTTTALTAFLLERTGLNPGYFIGGQPLDFENSSLLGKNGAPFVIEGDEYDTSFFDKRAKFFHYLPHIAVVTSIEFDHSDIYSDISEIEKAFTLMLRQIPSDGWLITCVDDPVALKLKESAFSNVATYGFNKNANWRGEKSDSEEGYQGFNVSRNGNLWARLQVPLTGNHNLLNTLASVAVAGTLGASSTDIEREIKNFKGVKRRMEIFLEADGITFIDDFAHHPTAIRETIQGVKERWKNRRLTVLFEPRSNTSATNILQDDLIEAFFRCDNIWIGPIYRSDRIPEKSRLDRDAVVKKLRMKDVYANYTDDFGEMVNELKRNSKRGDIILILSNGSFGGIYDMLRDEYDG